MRAALDAYVKGKRHERTAAKKPSTAFGEAGVDGLQHRLSELPDERDILVHDLRAKVRRGRYFVSSRDIVDALLGRLTADLLKHD